jgi:hypothetical protein
MRRPSLRLISLVRSSNRDTCERFTARLSSQWAAGRRRRRGQPDSEGPVTVTVTPTKNHHDRVNDSDVHWPRDSDDIVTALSLVYDIASATD